PAAHADTRGPVTTRWTPPSAERIRPSGPSRPPSSTRPRTGPPAPRQKKNETKRWTHSGTTTPPQRWTIYAAPGSKHTSTRSAAALTRWSRPSPGTGDCSTGQRSPWPAATTHGRNADDDHQPDPATGTHRTSPHDP